jgi:hypothetical protein
MNTIAVDAHSGRTYALWTAGISIGAYALTGDALLGSCLLVLGVVWFLLRPRNEPPVLALALTYQWAQVVIGLVYLHVTGRAVQGIYRSRYQVMVAIGLGCILALAVGLVVGRYLTNRTKDRPYLLAEVPVGWPTLFLAYIGAFFLEWSLREIAPSFSQLTQALIALSFARLGLLFLIVRRLCVPPVQWGVLALILMIEMGIGLTGFFAGFREPLIMFAIALGGLFDSRRPQHWALLVVAIVVGATVGIGWVTVRGTYREEITAEMLQTRAQRLSRMFDLSQQLRDLDEYGRLIAVDIFIERMWTVYYPALAVERVPAVLPHTNGQFTKAAVLHALQPRLLFPNKIGLTSDSEMVREYSGVHVAGIEQDTSIAFGYAAESYIDYGVPWMFLPIFAWGVFMGAAYGWLMTRLRCREFAHAVLAVIFWLALYLFERSWAKMIGTSGTMLIYLGVLGLLADRYLVRYHRTAAAVASNWPPTPVIRPE